jgi:hypothetical protein
MKTTDNGRRPWVMPALLFGLLLVGWLGGVALFASRGLLSSGTQAAEGAADADDIPDAVLASLGGLIGANLHQGYLNIGFLADAVEAQLYSVEEAQALLAAVSALIDTTEEQINKLPAASLPPEDQGCIERFRAAVGPLKVQVTELNLHWGTEGKEHAERFQQARAQSQAALAALVSK